MIGGSILFMKTHVVIPDQLVKEIDVFVKDRYNSRSAFLSEAAKEKIKREK